MRRYSLFAAVLLGAAAAVAFGDDKPAPDYEAMKRQWQADREGQIAKAKAQLDADLAKFDADIQSRLDAITSIEKEIQALKKSVRNTKAEQMAALSPVVFSFRAVAEWRLSHSLRVAGRSVTS